MTDGEETNPDAGIVGECGRCGRAIERGEWHTLTDDGTRLCWDCENRDREDFPGEVADHL
jgi:hypothetical protein